jgi:hypothetical protein
VRTRRLSLTVAPLLLALSLVALPTVAAARTSQQASETARASVVWGQPDKIDNTQDSPTSVSCASGPFCVAVDQEGNAVLFNGTSWSTPESIDPPGYYRIDGHWKIDAGRMVSVSCASPTFCVASDSYFAFIYNGKSWSKRQLVDPIGAQQTGQGGGLNSLSCPSPGFCAASASGHIYFLEGSTWADQGQIDPAAVSISCSSETFCMVVDGGGDSGGSRAFRNGTWDPRIDNGKHGGPTDISCVSASFCLGVDTGSTYIYDGTKWKYESALGSDGPDLVSCSSTTACEGVDTYGDAFRFNGASWSDPQLVDPYPPVGGGAYLAALSCTSSSFCETVDGEGKAVAYAGHSWETPTVIDPEAGFMKSVSCPSVRFCVAVDGGGAAFIYNGTSWTRQTAEQGERAVSCASVDLCVAVGFQGKASVFNGVSWSSPQFVDQHADNPGLDDLLAVTCPSTTYCAALDESSHWLFFDGTSWSTPALIAPEGGGDTLGLDSISCASSTFCLAVGNPSEYVYDGSSWSVTGTPASSLLYSVSCVSPTFCMAVDVDGYAYTFDGEAWSSPVPLSHSPVNSVQCVSESFCIAASGKGTMEFNGNRWSTQQVIDKYDRNIQEVSCATPTFCAAVDWDGLAWIGT